MLSYRVYSPDGNITALIEEPVVHEHRARLARQIMSEASDIEQVGYLVPSDGNHAFTLEMMGDELCVNAAQAAAHWWASSHKGEQFLFRISGLVDAVEGVVSEHGIALRFPSSLVEKMERKAEGTLVDLSGIRYLITENASLADVIATTLDSYLHPPVPADGLIIAQGNGTDLVIEPHVRVRATGTIVKESACGSGSIAAALAYADGNTPRTYRVLQPSGGVVTVELGADYVSFLGEVQELPSRETSDVILR